MWRNNTTYLNAVERKILVSAKKARLAERESSGAVPTSKVCTILDIAAADAIRIVKGFTKTIKPKYLVEILVAEWQPGIQTILDRSC